MKIFSKTANGGRRVTNKYSNAAWACCLAFVQTGCTSKQPSHVPPLWQWPVLAVQSAIENEVYDVRRGKVKRYIAQNYTALMQELSPQVYFTDATHVQQLCELARIAKHKRASIFNELVQEQQVKHSQKNRATSPSANTPINAGGNAAHIEALTVTFMVHGN